MAGLIFILFYYLQSLPRISYLSLFSAIYHYLKDLLMHLTWVFSCILIKILYAPVVLWVSFSHGVTFVLSKAQQYSLNWTILESFVCLTHCKCVWLFVWFTVCLSLPFPIFHLLRSCTVCPWFIVYPIYVYPYLSWPWWGTGPDRGAASWSRPGYKRPGRTATHRDTFIESFHNWLVLGSRRVSLLTN